MGGLGHFFQLPYCYNLHAREEGGRAHVAATSGWHKWTQGKSRAPGMGCGGGRCAESVQALSPVYSKGKQWLN